MRKKSDKKRLNQRILFIILFIIIGLSFFVIRSVNNSNIFSLTTLSNSKENFGGEIIDNTASINTANLKCEDFEEDILWSSNFSYNYQKEEKRQKNSSNRFKATAP